MPWWFLAFMIELLAELAADAPNAVPRKLDTFDPTKLDIALAFESVDCWLSS
jgi:hypothetical protein